MGSSNINGILSLISAILHQFSLYPLFMMSNIVPFMVSYLYHIQKESSLDNKSSLSQNDGYFIHPIMELSMSICCFFGGMVEHYLGPRLVIILGAFSIGLGDFLFIVSKNIIIDFFINIFFGIGFAIAMTAAVKNASKYFPNKRGLVNAVAGGFGGNLGSSFFNFVIKLFVSKGDFPDNDDNDMYKKSTAKNYKIFFFIHLGVVLGFGIISSILLVPYEETNKASNIIETTNIKEDKEEKDIKEEKEDTEVKDIKEKKEDNEEKEDKEEKEEEEKNKNNSNINLDNEKNNEKYKNGLKIILKNARIYRLLIIFLFTSFLQGFIFTVGFNYGTMDHGNKKSSIGGDEMSIIFTSTSLISSFIGPLFGLIYDNLGFKYTIIIIDIISVINGCLISITVRISVIFYGFSIILNGCLNGGAFSMIFPYVSKIYGFNYAGELYGFVVLSTGISTMMSASIYYMISSFSDDENNNDGAYLAIFLTGVVLNILAIILAFFEKDEPFSFDINENNDQNNQKLLNSQVI